MKYWQSIAYLEPATLMTGAAMTIEVSPDMEAKLRKNADALGLSVGQYVERLLCEEDSRRTRLDAFRRAFDERVESLDAGESVDGEATMIRLLAELNEAGQVRRRA
jgi:hypothetical protein